MRYVSTGPLLFPFFRYLPFSVAEQDKTFLGRLMDRQVSLETMNLPLEIVAVYWVFMQLLLKEFHFVYFGFREKVILGFFISYKSNQNIHLIKFLHVP